MFSFNTKSVDWKTYERVKRKIENGKVKILCEMPKNTCDNYINWIPSIINVQCSLFNNEEKNPDFEWKIDILEEILQLIVKITDRWRSSSAYQRVNSPWGAAIYIVRRFRKFMYLGTLIFRPLKYKTMWWKSAWIYSRRWFESMY